MQIENQGQEAFILIGTYKKDLSTYGLYPDDENISRFPKTDVFFVAYERLNSNAELLQVMQGMFIEQMDIFFVIQITEKRIAGDS